MFTETLNLIIITVILKQHTACVCLQFYRRPLLVIGILKNANML